ncbi:hypothetical protein LZT04_15675, partial [Vibrio fluvialis]|nr:hypothetical protein [Vibrio fluvialis]
FTGIKLSVLTLKTLIFFRKTTLGELANLAPSKVQNFKITRKQNAKSHKCHSVNLQQQLNFWYSWKQKKARI